MDDSLCPWFAWCDNSHLQPGCAAEAVLVESPLVMDQSSPPKCSYIPTHAFLLIGGGVRYENLSFMLEKMSQPASDHQNPATSIICLAGACIYLGSVFVALILITRWATVALQWGLWAGAGLWMVCYCSARRKRQKLRGKVLENFTAIWPCCGYKVHDWWTLFNHIRPVWMLLNSRQLCMCYMIFQVSLSVVIPVCKTMNMYFLLRYNLSLSIISQDKELGLADKELKND